MTGAEYTQALASLNLTPEQAAEWLGIGRSTAYRYLTEGAPGPVGRALGMAVAVMGLDRWDYNGYDGEDKDDRGDYVRQSDLTAAVGLGG